MLIAVLLALLSDPDVPTMAKPTDRACPFVVITVSGGPIDSFDKPHAVGKMASFRACPSGKLASYPAKEIDWPGTEKANAPRVVAAPTPEPNREELWHMAGNKGTLTAEELEERQKTWGQLRTKSGKTMSISSDLYFAESSVAKHLQSTRLLADRSSCPDGPLLIYGVVTNTSKLKLSELKGAFQIIAVYRNIDLEERSEVLVEQIQSLEPPQLLPGDRAEFMVHIPCKTIWRSLLSKTTRYSDPNMFIDQGVHYVLRDVGGKAEPLASPATEPFPVGTPAGAKTSSKRSR